MSKHEVQLLIEKADTAINQEDFETLINIYSEDAVLIIKPGMSAVGKEQIAKAFVAIANHFDRTLDVKQGDMHIIETEDTALVLAKTLISARNQPVIERKATYVFKKHPHKGWLCFIDNSYGHDLLEDNA